ncbi:MAG: hypothetical protein R3F56_09275 [Planctomycetota bacterium]
MQRAFVCPGPAFLLCAAVCAQKPPTVQDVFADLPKELVSLVGRISDRASLGAELASAITGPRGSLSAGLARLRRELPAWLQGTDHEDLLQASTGRGADAYWYSFTFLAADLDAVEQGENEQGKVRHDRGWRGGRRSFDLEKDGTVCHLSQVRASWRSGVYQRSGYYWQRGGYQGRGIDWLVPVVGADGRVQAHLLVSVYSHDYDVSGRKGKAAGSTQRQAVRDWTQRTARIVDREREKRRGRA